MIDESDNGYATFRPKRPADRRNPGQKLISTREELTVSQIEKDWAGDVSAWPEKRQRPWWAQ